MNGAGVETPRLLLRPLALADLDRLTEIWTDPDLARLLLTRPRNGAEVAEKLSAMIEQ
jgi:RimJ/RimL family protein N-acetyltransferase